MVARFLTRMVDAQAPWARPLGDLIQRIVHGIFRPIKPIQNLLNGTWLGHPLHAVLTDVPVGALTVLIVLDVLDYRGAADIALGLGILSMLAAMLAGFADYAETDGLARQRATVHQVIMIAALVVYAVSLALRLGGPVDRTAPVVASILGYLLISAGAYIGGDVVFALGNMVDRHASRGRGTAWAALEVPGELPEGTLVKARMGAQTLVLVRSGETVLALHDTCAHAGCSLAGGKLLGREVECPCHGSRYELATGHHTRGPAVYDQPSYEVRRSASGWEARRTNPQN